MNHSQSTIDRYLNGMMTTPEQTQFAAQLAADPGLRAALQAEQLIRATVRSDLAAFPAEHALTRLRVMESLAAVKAPAGVAAGGAAWYASGGLLKGFLGAIAVAGLSVGGYVMMQEPSTTVTTKPMPATPSVAVPQSQPLALPELSTDPASTLPTPEAATPSTEAAVSPAAKRTTGDSNNRMSKAAVPSNASSSSSADAASAASKPQATEPDRADPPQTIARPPAVPRQLRVVSNDSVKLKMQVKVK